MARMKRLGVSVLLVAAATSGDWKSLNGQEAPSFEVTQWFNQAEGSSLADFLGKAVLLEYWATW
jgi:hypothetical protein